VQCAGDAAPVQLPPTSSMIFLSLAYQAIDD
jgi:p-aminobenzoyl-glutamate transporter AbgT